VNSQSVENVKDQAARAVHKAAPWIEKIGRFGFVAKGIVYASIGIMAIRGAWHYRRSATDPYGALNQLASKPHGEILLFAIAFGLFGYAVWRIIEAIVDPERKGNGLGGIVQRGGFVVSAVVYSTLGVTAFKVATGIESRAQSANEQDWAATILSQPFGAWLIGLGGLVMIGIGVAHFYMSFTAKFCESLAYYRLTNSEKHWTIRIGRFGYAARAVVFSVIGLFLLKTAIEHDASEAGGFREALIELATQPYGLWILAAAGAGVLAYAIHLFVEATCKRFPL